MELWYIMAELFRLSVNTTFLSMYLDFPRRPCYGKNNAESVWRQTKAECDVCLLRCSPTRVTLSESCETLLYHFVPPAWLWNVLSRNMRAATLTATCFLVSTQWILLVVGLEDITPAHCTAVTAFRGLTTRLKLQTQPQQTCFSSESQPQVKSHSGIFPNFRFVSEMICCRGTRGQVQALMSLCRLGCEEFLSE